MSNKRSLLIISLIAALLLAGCKAKQPANSTRSKTKLILYCGAGIRPPVDELIEAFTKKYGMEVSPDFAGSQVLLSKIKVSKKGDLYMPGDAWYVDQAADAKLVASRKSVGYWIPTILVQKGNPKQIKTVEDLTRPGIRLGVGDPNVCAIGKITRQLLEKHSIKWSDMEKHIAFKSLTVNELGLQIQAKSLDAVIVWDAMARYFAKWGDEVSIPTADNIISSIDIAVLTCSSDQKAATQFVDFLTSTQGKEIFAKHNYTTEKPKD